MALLQERDLPPTRSPTGPQAREGLRRRRRLRVGITQLLYVLAGVVLGLLLPRSPCGSRCPSAEAAQMLLAVGAGLLTFIGVVFSLLFLVVQFGSTTFTPRLNLFYSSPIVWHAFASTPACSSSPSSPPSARARRGMTGCPHRHHRPPLVAIALFRSLQMRAFSSIQLARPWLRSRERGRQVLDGVYPDRAAARGRR